MDTKLQQLESLMASRLIFGPESDREEGREVVRALEPSAAGSG
jgi:hypothetical protein